MVPCRTLPISATRLAELLPECGALSVSLADAEDEPLYEPAPGTTPLWSSTRVTGLFPGDTDATFEGTGPNGFAWRETIRRLDEAEMVIEVEERADADAEFELVRVTEMWKAR